MMIIIIIHRVRETWSLSEGTWSTLDNSDDHANQSTVHVFGLGNWRTWRNPLKHRENMHKSTHGAEAEINTTNLEV